jgi:hypothetical protein
MTFLATPGRPRRRSGASWALAISGTVRAAVRALYKAGYIEIIFDPVLRSNSYKPIYAAGDEGKSAPIDGGNIAPTIGALSPSSMGALLTNDEGQSAPQSNLINKPREETRRTAARRPNGITEALNQIIERFEKKDRGADPEGHRGALTDRPPLSGPFWMLV